MFMLYCILLNKVCTSFIWKKHTYLNLKVVYCWKCWPLPDPSVSCSSNIKDFRSEITITNIIKKFEIPWAFPKGNTETWSKQILLEKWCWQTCLMQGCINLQFMGGRGDTILQKHKEAKNNKKRCACSNSHTRLRQNFDSKKKKN